MADRARRVRIYDLHSWTGVSLGLMLFVVAFTGCLALFHEELHPWEDPAQRLMPVGEHAPVHDQLTNLANAAAEKGTITFAGVFPANDHHPHATLQANWRTADGGNEQKIIALDGTTGARIAVHEDGANRFLYDLHRDLAWPEILGGRQVGRFIVGVVGIAFLLLILTGVIAHSKIKKELFSLRYLRSVRLKWQDTHKVFGLWTLPFSTMIALTGAWLGVIALLLPLFAAIVAKGDVETLTAELGIGADEPAGIAAPMIPVDRYVSSTHPDTGQPLYGIFIENWGDRNAVYKLNYFVDDRLKFFDEIAVSGVTGEPVAKENAFNADRAIPRMSAAFSPLHYGIFGGITLKIVYLLLGLALAIMAALGNMMWIERRLHGGEGRKSARFYRRLSALNTGVCAGLPLASVVALAFDKLYWGAEAARYGSAALAFFIVWGTALAYAFVRNADYRATKELLGATGGLFLLLPVLNAAVTGDLIWTSFGTGAEPAAWFDIAFLVTGLAVVMAAYRLPSARPIDRRRSTRVAETSGVETVLQPAE
ncbi:MAG: PepSY-associated TM helix domain-containing protein [Pseudomonadota bacterium]